MEFVLKKDIPYFTECEALVEGLGFKLVDLTVVRAKDVHHVKAVIKSHTGIGIKDCTKVHRILQPRLEALIGTQDITMEVSSPGVNRVIKKTTELYAFLGDSANVWDSNITDWRSGILEDVNERGIVLNCNGESIVISYDNIKKVRCNL